MPSSRGSSQPMSLVSCIGERVLYHQRHLGSLIFADTEVNDWVSLLLLLLLSRFSRVRLCATPQRAAHQAALSLGLSRQEYRSGLPFPSPTHACMHAKLLQSSPALCQCTGFSRQEYWSELPFPSPTHACMLSCFSHLQLYASPQDSPGKNTGVGAISFSTPWWFSGKESTCQCRRLRFNPWVGKIPCRRNRNGNPIQYSCLGNPMDRGAWWATVHGVTKESDMSQQLNNDKQIIANLGERSS